MHRTIAVLARQPALASALTRLTGGDARTLEWQATLSAVPAPTGAERRRGTRVAEIMEEIGLAHIGADEVGNVLGWSAAPSGEPAVVVAAHLDTVFGPDVDVAVRRDGTRLMGPGIADNARGLAAMLAVAEAFVMAGWDTERPVAFAATVGEEGAGNLRGARHLFGNGHLTAHAAIILDGAGDDRVVHAALGSRRYRVGFSGPGGHSWSAFGVANPAHAAGAMAQIVAELPRPATPRSTCSVVRIGGGTSLNSIPDDAWIEVDLRSEGAAPLEEIELAIRAAARLITARLNAQRTSGTPPLAHAVELLGDRPSGLTPTTHPLVQASLAATRAIGRRPTLATASTDGNIPISLGIPAVTLGGGGKAGEAHRASEWYENVDGPLGIYRVLLVLAAAAGVRGTR